MSNAIIQHESGIKGLSAEQLLAACRHSPLASQRANAVAGSQYNNDLEFDTAAILGQIAGEEREISRLISMPPDYSDPSELEPRHFIETKKRDGTIHREQIQPTAAQRYYYLR